jgi:hypothetical protein
MKVDLQFFRRLIFRMRLSKVDLAGEPGLLVMKRDACASCRDWLKVKTAAGRWPRKYGQKVGVNKILSRLNLTQNSFNLTLTVRRLSTTTNYALAR